jgi:hypothetical protein
MALVLVTLVRRLRRASNDPEFRTIALMTAALLAIGTAFYTNVEGWSPLDSLYFCVVTLATVGYGDLAPHTGFGKAFTVVYIMLGIGVIVAFADRLVKGDSKRGRTWHHMKQGKVAGRPRFFRGRANGRQHHQPPPPITSSRGGGERSADV